jgi:O-antigen/teichoic acid export membrane protein
VKPEAKNKAGWGLKAGTVYMVFSNTLNAVLIFGFQTLGVRMLKPERFGVVSVLYSAVVLASFVVGQPFELTLSKHVSECEANGQNCLTLIRRVLSWQALGMALFVCICLPLRTLIVQRLFPEAPSLFYLAIACGVCYGFEIGTRGVMRGLREFGYYGTLAIGTNFFRVVLLLLLVGVVKMGLLGAGLSILLASMANILLSLFWYRRVWNRLKGKEDHVGQDMTMRHLLGYIVPAMAMFGCVTYFYNTGPIFIKLLGGSSANEVAGLFLIAAMVARSPLQISEALSANLLPSMSRLCAQGDWRSVRGYVAKSYQLFIPLSLTAIGGAALLGPEIIRLIYPGFSYSRMGLTLLVVGTVVLIMMAAPGQFLMARSKVANVATGWLVGCVALTLVVFMMPGDLLFRLEIGYLVAGLGVSTCHGLFAYRALAKMQAEQKKVAGIG